MREAHSKQSAGNVVSTREGAKRPPMTLAVLGAAALFAVFAVSDKARGPGDALEECVDYAATLRRCFGERSAAHAPPAPKTEAERAVARKRCAADRARIERACR